MNVKPGDLAIVIGAMRTFENIGCVVEVIRPAVHLEIFQSIDGSKAKLDMSIAQCWVVRGPRPLAWRNLIFPQGKYFSELPIDDCYLRPITGLPIDDEVTEELKVEA